MPAVPRPVVGSIAAGLNQHTKRAEFSCISKDRAPDRATAQTTSHLRRQEDSFYWCWKHHVRMVEVSPEERSMTRTTHPFSPSVDQQLSENDLAHGLQVPEMDSSQEEQWDSVEAYFECITTCSLDDGECVTHCVEELREHH